MSQGLKLRHVAVRLALAVFALLLPFCSALLNPNPDSLSYRDADARDTIYGMDNGDEKQDVQEDRLPDIVNDNVEIVDGYDGGVDVEDEIDMLDVVYPDDGSEGPSDMPTDETEEEIAEIFDIYYDYDDVMDGEVDADEPECGNGIIEETEECDNDSACCIECIMQPDFTPCVVVTDPDRDYDICISGECRSPGCGDETCNPPGPHFPLPDTNQRACYDGDGALMDPCPGTPSDPSCATTSFCGQDAQYGWDTEHEASLRFTVSEPGPAGQPVVLDNVTGLEWQGCPSGQSGSDCSEGSLNTMDWEAAIAYCEALTWGGLEDWRLPDRYELQSIVDYGRVHPSIDASAFPGTSSYYFWSSSSYAASPSRAWYEYFGCGETKLCYKDEVNAVRCVRRSEASNERFTRTGSDEPVVTDNVTGLVWQGCPAGLSNSDCSIGSYIMQNWQGSLSYCESLNWGGHEDWYLPDIKELASIVDDHTADPCIDASAFLGTPSIFFWSASYLSISPSYALGVYFFWGGVSNFGKVGEAAVRCVRHGP